MKIAVLLPVHDPKGVNLEKFQRIAHVLESLYDERFATVSDQTDFRWVEELDKHQFRVKVIQKKGASHARRELVKFGLTGSMDYFHYGDYDRIVTWALHHKEELERVVKEIPHYDYTIIGRTERALLTHPAAWVETERITNTVFSLEFGQPADICAGSCAFSRRAGEEIALHSSPEQAFMTDAEWPMIVHRMTPFSVGVLQAEGLEYQDEINAIHRPVTSTEEWLGRIKLCYEISKSAMEVGKLSERTFTNK